MRITRYQAIGFSCYGTLVDREGGILEALRPLVAQAGLSTHPDWLLGSYHRLARELRQATPNASQTSLHQRGLWKRHVVLAGVRGCAGRFAVPEQVLSIGVAGLAR